MKISSASKKVLASALSAAMVLAFSPAAMAAVNNDGNAGETQTPIEGNTTIGNGVVTKAATCGVDGYMTFTASDGSETLAIIPATGKHASYVLDTSKYADGVDWTSKDSGKATIHVKCADCGTKATVDAKVTKKVEDPTFGAAGKTTYTAAGKDAAGKEWTATLTEPSAQLTATSATAEFDLDGNAVCRLAVTDGTKTFKYTSAATKKVTPGTCTAEEKTAYVATFDVTGFSATSIAALSKVADTTIAKVEIANNTMTVTSVATMGKKDAKNHGDNITKSGEIKTAAGSANTTTVNGIQTYKDKDIEVVYTGTGSLADATATTENGFWTIKATCTEDHEVVYEKSRPAKVSKKSCPKGVYYLIDYAGGTFTLKTEAKATETLHAWEAKAAFDADGNFTVTYTCACCGMAKTFKGSLAGDNSAWDKIKVVDNGTAATCQAAGTKKYSATISNWLLVSDDIIASTDKSTATFESETFVDPKKSHSSSEDFTVGANWLGAKGEADISITCAAHGYKKVINTKAIAAHHNQQGIDSSATAGYTDYSATFALPEGFDANGAKIKYGAAKVLTPNADGTYTVTDEHVNDTAVAEYAADAANDDTKAVCWTVKESGKKYVATKVAKTEDKCTGKVVYTVTYGSGKTVVAEVADNSIVKHEFKLDHFVTTYGSKGEITSVKAVEKCSVDGKTTIDTTGTLNGNFYTFKMSDGSELKVSKFRATSYTYGEPTFAWTAQRNVATGNMVVTATATFVSTDGKMKFEAKDIPAELVDAETGTYKVTVPSSMLPEGWTGKAEALTATKAVEIHEGHNLVQTELVKATSSKAGYTKYYCNNDGMTYIKVIAKDNMKVSPAKKSFKASTVKKKAQKFTVKVKSAKGKVSFKSNSKKVTVSKSGKVTVKKGTKKGTYKVTVTSAATKTYAKNAKTVKIVVK